MISIRWNNIDLRSKTIILSVALAVFSILISFIATNYSVNQIVFEKFSYVNKIVTSAAVDKTNTYLLEITKIINLALKDIDMSEINEDVDTNSYDKINLRRSYQNYLQGVIEYNDRIDAVIIVNKEATFNLVASNVYGKAYGKYRKPESFERIRKYIENGGNQEFFIDKYIEPNYERVGVIHYISGASKGEIQGYIIVVLSKKLSNEFSFAIDKLYLSDGTGSTAAVIEKNQSQFKKGNIYSNNLLMENWEIINGFSFEQIHDLLNKNIHIYLIGCLIYVFIVLIVSFVVSSIITRPLKYMQVQVKNIDTGNLSTESPHIIKTIKRKIGIKKSILIFNILIVAIPVVCITGLSFLNSKDIIDNRIGSVADYSTQLISQQTEFIMTNYYKTAIDIMANEVIQQNLYEGNEINRNRGFEDEVLKTILQNNMLGEDIVNIALFDKRKNICFSSNYNVNEMKNEQTKELLLKSNSTSPVWTTYKSKYINQKCYRICLQVRAVSQGIESGELLGYLLLDFDAGVVQREIQKIKENNNAFAYLLNTDDNDVLNIESSNKELNYIIRPFLNANKNLVLSKSDLQDGMNHYTVFTNKIYLNNWKLIFVLKNFNENRQLIVVNIFVLIILILISFITSYGTTFVAIRNLYNLMKLIVNVRKGNTDVYFETMGGDEVAELGKSFNDMVVRLNNTINEVVKSQMQIKDAELKAKEFQLNLLQSQINPHFLYNTLKTIQYMIYENDQRAEEMVRLLISLFQTGIIKGEKEVPFKEEMNHVETYIAIQNVRFSDKFETIFRIQDEIMNMQVLKLTLQPVIENAIYHGLELSSTKGKIVICGNISRDKIRVRVFDNGLGITKDRLMELRQFLSGQKASTSIGMMNVHERIRLKYGEGFGLKINSTFKKGTIVTLYYPIKI